MMTPPLKECEYCGAVGHMPTFMNGETMCYACLGSFPKTAHGMRKEIAKLRALHTTAPSAQEGRDAEKERDALRARIARMEKQGPVAFALYSGWVCKAVCLSELEACEQRDRRQLTADLSGSLEAYRVVPLYALPGAKGE